MKINQEFFNRVGEAVAAFLVVCAFVIGGLFLVAIAYRAVESAIPDAQLFVDVAFFTMAFAFSFGALQKIDALEKKMIEIDEENDRRDDANFHHVEVCLQDVQWLVKKRLDDEQAAAARAADLAMHPIEY